MRIRVGSGGRAVALVVVLVVLGAWGSACGGGGSHKQTAASTAVATTVPPSTTTTEAASAAGLRSAAQVILAAYAAGDWGTFWDRWDLASQALITRNEYIRRKTACPGVVGQPITIVSALPAANRIWNVRGRRAASATTYQFRWSQGVWSYVVTDPTVKAELKGSYDKYVGRPGCKTAAASPPSTT
jgi:hypothetical protein